MRANVTEVGLVAERAFHRRSGEGDRQPRDDAAARWRRRRSESRRSSARRSRSWADRRQELSLLRRERQRHHEYAGGVPHRAGLRR